MQEALVFDQKVIDQDKCQLILGKMIYYFSLKGTLKEEEGSSLFFQIIKLFQCQSNTLKQLIYTALSCIPIGPSICMITNSLNKDLVSSVALIKVVSMETLSQVLG